MIQPISQPLQPAQPSILTNPQGAVSSGIANIEDYIAQKLKDQTVKSMLIGGSFGLILGLVLYPIGQSLMGYTTVKKSDLPPQDYAY
jgi:hypothetical protein